jgi:hypothetical protein
MLWLNRDALRTAGIFLPGDGQHDHFRLGRDVREVPRDPRSPEQPWDGELERMVGQIVDAGEPTSVVTEERLCGATAEQVARVVDLLADFEVHVVYGVRSFSGLLTSAWQQTVKHRDVGPLTAWLEEIRRHDPREWFWRAHDLPDVLTRWGRVGEGRVHVITFPGADADGHELWRRFASVIGAPVHGIRAIGRTNRSLGFTEATLLSRIQAELPRDLLGYHRESIVHWFIAEDVLGADRAHHPIVIPESHREWIAAETARRVEYLRSSAHEVVGDLGDLADHDQAFGDPAPGEDPEEMLDAAVRTIAALVTLDASDREETTRLEQRIGELEASLASQATNGPGPPSTAQVVRRRLGRLRRRVEGRSG